MPIVLKSIVGNIACPTSLNTPANSLLVTLDVPSLHSNIPQNEDINGCEHLLCTSSHNTIPTSTLCDHIRMILTMSISLPMITTTFKSTALPWVLKWHPLLLTIFWVILTSTLWKMPHLEPHTWTDRQPLF